MKNIKNLNLKLIVIFTLFITSIIFYYYSKITYSFISMNLIFTFVIIMNLLRHPKKIYTLINLSILVIQFYLIYRYLS